MKKISLIQLRLELDQGYPILSSLTYNAESYLKYSEDQTTSILTHHQESYKEIPEIHHGKRTFLQYTIETYDLDMETNKNDSTMEHQKESDDADKCPVPHTVHYFSGNPNVEVTRGIMHLYKDNCLSTLGNIDIPRSDTICMLGVPAKYSCQDLQNFIAPTGETVRHIQIIRDGNANQYMVLIRFKDQESSDAFYREYEGKAYNMLEDECTHLMFVSKVESVATTGSGYLPVPGLTELPICPVCLERMDESVEGILTILCNHSFHNNCLMKWQDSCCPVCRYVLTPEVSVDQKCFECDSNESLWICLVCGHIGCGRYQDLHAYQHYQQTAHTYSMDLGNKRVWDYAGDNYVHRLVQNKGDGKLVSLDNREQVEGEKMDSLTIEYTYLLTNQLESQRRYFEEKIDFLEKDAYEKLSLMELEVHNSRKEYHTLEQMFAINEKDKKMLEKKYENVVGKLANMCKELRDEKQLNICLRENQAVWQKKVELLENELKKCSTEKSAEIYELQNQVADLIKHLEVQSAVRNANEDVREDIQAGQLFTEACSSSGNASRNTKKKSKARKK
ncbi:BRCA1-associated protein isoform X1 [Hydra vulgaris]|nr:BRCA1-associated protein [Hydra vulgaris]